MMTDELAQLTEEMDALDRMREGALRRLEEIRERRRQAAQDENDAYAEWYSAAWKLQACERRRRELLKEEEHE